MKKHSLTDCSTLVEMLRRGSAEFGHAILYRFLQKGDIDGPVTEWSFRELDRRARIVALAIPGDVKPGQRAVLLYPPGLDFVSAFFGCMYRGLIAVPAYPPDPRRLDRSLPRLRSIAKDCSASVILTTEMIAQMGRSLTSLAPELGALRWTATDLAEGPMIDDADVSPVTSGDLAFLQYTSGSTGVPKGVCITHANILHNEAHIARAFGLQSGIRAVGWLPVYHDMGLIGNLFQPLYKGFTCTLMSPLDFLARPMRWLRAISALGATTSGGPNFAYDLCVRKSTEEDLAQLDLHTWEVAFNGAEPVRRASLDAFYQRFASCGFRRRTFLPCYGLAEATLLVSAIDYRAEPSVVDLARSVLEGDGASGTVPIASCGAPDREQVVVIVEPESRRWCGDGVVGEIWVHGPNVAQGYWDWSDAANAEVFAARIEGAAPHIYTDLNFLRTGDLGMLIKGELLITGRLKDLIIVNGRNYYPQDIERIAEQTVGEIRPGCLAAFVVDEDRVVLVAELEGLAAADQLAALEQQVRRAVNEQLELRIHEVVFIAPRSIAKTSSGKIQRQPCRLRYLQGELERLLPALPTSAQVPVTDSEGQLASICDEIRQFIAAELGLTVDKVAPEATAAELGLDSLMMSSVQTAIEDRRRVRLEAMTFWHDGSARSLAQAVRTASVVPATASSPRTGREENVETAVGDGGAEVSLGQARLWVLDRLAPGIPLYNLLFGIQIEGSLDVDRLASALAAVVARHPALRTRIVAPDGEPRAHIAAVGTDLVYEDLGVEVAPEQSLRARALALGSEPFDLAAGPLLRSTLLRVSVTRHVLCLTVHHAVADGWSARVLADELVAAYRGEALAAVTPGFDAAAERAALPAMTNAREFWKRQLEGLPTLELPAARSRPAAPTFAGATHGFSLPADLVRAIGALAARDGVTPYVVLVAAYSTLLYRTSGSEDFGIGTAFANRLTPGSRRSVGFYANTLLLRCRPAAAYTVRHWLHETQRVLDQSIRHGSLPFSEVVALSDHRNRSDLSPLFRAALLFESAAIAPAQVDAMTWSPWTLTPDGSVPGTAKFDLSLLVAPDREGWSAALEYSTELFDAVAIERMAGHLTQLLRAMVQSPDLSLAELPMVTPQERLELVDRPALLVRSYRRDRGVHQLFEEQAKRSPDAAAVVFEDQSASYRELDQRANVLAAQLFAAGVQPGDRVAVCVQRSLEMMVSLLGVLKARAAYVPLDPEYPADRLRYVLEDSGVTAVVVHTATAHLITDPHPPMIWVDRPESTAPVLTAPEVFDPDALMYMIYTSGSTGRPKGVRVPHRCVVAFLAAMDERLGVPAQPQGQAWLALSSISFDISVLELFWPLTHGMAVVLQQEVTPGRARPGPISAPGVSTRPIDFGLFYFAADQAQSTRDAYRLLLDGARFADERGLSSVWMPERHFHAFGGLYPNPSVTAAAVAAITKRVALRAGSVVMPLHHPVRVAEEWSVVDNLSNGRVGLSVASGWHANDFVFAPERFAARKEHMLDGLDVVRRLWRGEAVAFPNGQGKSTDVRLHPRPVQAELPIWLTAAGSAETFEAAGAMGAGILTHLLGQSMTELADKLKIYRGARSSAGFAGPGDVTLMLHTFVAPDRDFVRAQVEGPFRAYLKSSSDLLRGFAANLGVGDGARPFTSEELDVLVDHAFRRYFETAGLFGTPESCRDQVEQLQALGVSEIGCLIDFGVPADTVIGHLDSLHALSRQAGTRTQFSIPQQIRTRGVTHLQCTPSLAQMLSLDHEHREALARVPTLLLGGEAMPVQLAQRLAKQRADLGTRGLFLNMYGPTETTIWSTSYQVTGDESSVPIGRPIANTLAYVLNEALQPCPIGVTGELFLAGDGVVAGYHGRPELDAERFVADPFVANPAGALARMYRTGDRAVWREDGDLGFLGRNDDQVKLRGHRIELGEIEAVMERLGEVAKAVAHVWEAGDGDRRLVAYVMVRPGSDRVAVEESLRSALTLTLPASMIPGVFVFVTELPYTPNGKINRRALPAPEMGNPSAPRELTPPRNDLERKIAVIWSEILGVAAVGRDESFFDLGGHSLLMARVHARLKAEVGVELPLVKLFQYPTIAHLVSHIEGGGASVVSTEQVQAQASRQRGALARLGQRGKAKRDPRS